MWTEHLRGDLKEVAKQAPVWVQTKSIEQIERQHALGNSKQFTASVDGSKSKPITQAQRKVIVYFVSAVLTRSLGRAKEVLRRAILRATERRTGALSEGWEWFLQQGGKSGTLTRLGANLPTDMSIKATDRLILAPRAGYAWFANYYTLHSRTITVRFARARKDKAGGRFADGRDPGQARAIGFMAQAARQLRPELKRINFSVIASWTKSAPPGPAMGWRSKKGIPILVFRALRASGGG